MLQAIGSCWPLKDNFSQPCSATYTWKETCSGRLWIDSNQTKIMGRYFLR